MNFINTLPCPINVSYHTGGQIKWIEVNATSYMFERNLRDQPVEVTAHLINPVCGQVNFSTPTWTGTIKGASTKVSNAIITINLFHLNQLILYLPGIFSGRYWTEWNSRSGSNGQ